MAVATNIVLADALATPVNHTFLPIGMDPSSDAFYFVDQSQSNEIGYWRIGVRIKAPSAPKAGESSKNRVRRIQISLEEPILEALSNNSAGYTPSPTVAYIPRANIEYVLHERCSLQNRKDLRKMSYNLLNDANIVSVVESLTYLS